MRFHTLILGVAVLFMLITTGAVHAKAIPATKKSESAALSKIDDKNHDDHHHAITTSTEHKLTTRGDNTNTTALRDFMYFCYNLNSNEPLENMGTLANPMWLTTRICTGRCTCDPCGTAFCTEGFGSRRGWQSSRDYLKIQCESLALCRCINDGFRHKDRRDDADTNATDQDPTYQTGHCVQK